MATQKRSINAHLWARDKDDWYVDQRWVSAALFAVERFHGEIVDPACGLGHILDSAWQRGYRTVGFDIRDRGASKRHHFAKADFFKSTGDFENIVSNPPYIHGDEFVRGAVARSLFKTALLLRTQWANSGARSLWLERLPLKRVLAITPRPSMPPGRALLAGAVNDSGGKQDYSWFIFERGYEGEPTFGWARRA